MMGGSQWPCHRCTRSPSRSALAAAAHFAGIGPAVDVFHRFGVPRDDHTLQPTFEVLCPPVAELVG